MLKCHQQASRRAYNSHDGLIAADPCGMGICLFPSNSQLFGSSTTSILFTDKFRPCHKMDLLMFTACSTTALPKQVVTEYLQKDGYATCNRSKQDSKSMSRGLQDGPRLLGLQNGQFCKTS